MVTKKKAAIRKNKTNQQARSRTVGWQARWEQWQGMLAPGFMALAVLLAWFGQQEFLAKHLPNGLGLWVLAGICGYMVFRKQPNTVASTLEQHPQWEMLAVGLISLIALGVRLWRLNEIPHGFHFDEAVNALIGQQIIQDAHYLPIFGPSDAPLPTFFHYLNVVALKFGGFTVSAVKFVPALIGTATVVMFYFLARQMVSRPVALAVALFLALFRWHINFSRINYVGILTPLFATAAVYFLLKGIETKNRWHMAFSGLAVSLGLYTYYASNLVPFILGPYMLLQLLWDRKFIKEQWLNLLVFLGVSVLVFAPLGYFALTHSDRFFSRNGQVLIFNHVPPSQAMQALFINIKTTLLMFNYFGDCNGRHNLPELPMLTPLAGLFFGLGLFWAITQLQRKHAFLIVWWFLIALVPGFFTIEAPQGYRCIGAIIPVSLLVAFGLERLWQGVKALAKETFIERWLWVGLLAVVLITGGQDLKTYFDDQANTSACWAEFNSQEFAIGNRIHDLGPSYHSYISAGSYDYPTIRFIGYPYLDSEPFQMINSVPSSYQGEKNLSFMLLPIHDSALELLKFYYPGGKQTLHHSPFDFMLFTSYEISHEEVMRTRGLEGHFHSASGAEKTQRMGETLFQFKLADLGLCFPLEASWFGTVRLPFWGNYSFRLEGVKGARVLIDGRTVSEQSVELAQGTHRIAIQASIAKSSQDVALYWRRGDSGTWNIVPGYALSPRTQVHGLTGNYFRTPDWQGTPDLRRVDPLISMLGADFPMCAPFSAEWRGTIHIPQSGTYAFSTLSNEGSWLWINGQQVVANEFADHETEGQIQLKAGDYPLILKYQKKAGAYPRIVLSWTAPGKIKQKIPFTALSPDSQR